MKCFVFSAPHGRGRGTSLRKPWLLVLPAAAGLLAGAAVADERTSGDSPREAEVIPRAAVAVRVTSTPLVSRPAEQAPLTLHDAINLAERSRVALQSVRDYTAEFTKTEQINGRLRKQVMEMKLRAQPFSVYLKYQSKREAGRQAIYVDGMYDSRLLPPIRAVRG